MISIGQNFREEVLWKGKHSLRVAVVTPATRDKISNGLKDMSQESIRNRFLGTKKEFSEKELRYLTEIDGTNHFALGLEETGGLKRGVAIIRMVRSEEFSRQAEVAITIIDEYQKMGLGLFLMDLMVLAALERGIDQLSFTYLPQNDLMLKLIRKLGEPRRIKMDYDFTELLLELKFVDLELVKARLQKSLPAIQTYYSKT